MIERHSPDPERIRRKEAPGIARNPLISPRKVLVASVSVIAAFAASTVPAAASGPTTASGTYASSLVSIDVVRGAGGVLFVREVDTDQYGGDLVGAATDTYTTRGLANGSFTGQGTEVCDSCTLGGRTGAYTAVFTFTGSGSTFTGHETFTSGTGGLAGLHGGGNFQGIGLADSYSYSYHFVP